MFTLYLIFVVLFNARTSMTSSGEDQMLDKYSELYEGNCRNIQRDGICIDQVSSPASVLMEYEEMTSLDDCFRSCCILKDVSGCNAISFYIDDDNTPSRCVLLNCTPSENCTWREQVGVISATVLDQTWLVNEHARLDFPDKPLPEGDDNPGYVSQNEDYDSSGDSLEYEFNNNDTPDNAKRLDKDSPVSSSHGFEQEYEYEDTGTDELNREYQEQLADDYAMQLLARDRAAFSRVAQLRPSTKRLITMATACCVLAACVLLSWLLCKCCTRIGDERSERKRYVPLLGIPKGTQ